MKENPPDAYSQLGMILARENVSVLALQRKLAAAGVPVNVKSLYRLAEDAPVQKIDLRIAAAICRTFDIALDDLISLDKPKAQLRRLDARRQVRLDALMDKNNEGQLTTLERKEFVALADMAHRISIENARTLLTERRRAGKASAVAKKTASQKRTPIAA
jgi:DNA-binding Xre family transcriptional regulator